MMIWYIYMIYFHKRTATAGLTGDAESDEGGWSGKKDPAGRLGTSSMGNPWEIYRKHMGNPMGSTPFVRLGQEWTGKSQGPNNPTTQPLNSCFLTWYHISKMEKLRSTFHDLQELCASCDLEVERVTDGFVWKRGISSKWQFSSIFPFFRQTHILKHPHEV